MIHLTKAAYYLVQFIRQLIALFKDPPVFQKQEQDSDANKPEAP